MPKWKLIHVGGFGDGCLAWASGPKSFKKFDKLFGAVRVTHLSTYHLFGGAAVAATRLHRALTKVGQVNGSIESTMLVGTSNRQETHRPEPGVMYLANNFLAEQTAFGRFVAERLYFLPHERDSSVRFQFFARYVWGCSRLSSGHPASGYSASALDQFLVFYRLMDCSHCSV